MKHKFYDTTVEKKWSIIKDLTYKVYLLKYIKNGVFYSYNLKFCNVYINCIYDISVYKKNRYFILSCSGFYYLIFKNLLFFIILFTLRLRNVVLL